MTEYLLGFAAIAFGCILARLSSRYMRHQQLIWTEHETFLAAIALIAFTGAGL